ncbi:MAG: 2-oxo-4-hydroxy-4-carboxy-5-ureidoimidazoline decarboxylase [Myxococcales bacterium]|nr:2-oxo-4-hydroxy-4-carboxy-5-ureidoimidazoline decarboxylase [Myxococcales bacterium]
MSQLQALNCADAEEACDLLRRCCGAERWVLAMEEGRPYRDVEHLVAHGHMAWATMTPQDVLEALDHHPRIGTDLEQLRQKFGSTADWAAGEQAGAQVASEEVLRALRDGNERYEQRFGHIFVVCATGQTAEGMLDALRSRLDHGPEEELKIAAGEQAKILEIRLRKLAA